MAYDLIAESQLDTRALNTSHTSQNPIVAMPELINKTPQNQSIKSMPDSKLTTQNQPTLKITSMTTGETDKIKIAELEEKVAILQYTTAKQQDQLHQMMSMIKELSLKVQQLQGVDGSFNNNTIPEETSFNETFSGDKSFSKEKSIFSQNSLQRVESQGNAPSFMNKQQSNISQPYPDAKSKKRSSDPMSSYLQKTTSKFSSRSSLSPQPLGMTISRISKQLNSSEEEDSEVDHSDASRTQENTNNQQFDIAFLHADVLVYRGKDNRIKSMNQDQQLSADVMYQQLIDNLVETKQVYRVLNRYLNVEQLKIVLVSQKPRLLFLNCHGGIDLSAPHMTYLSCEDQNIPTLQSRLDENQLSQLVRDAKVQLVVISACHSSTLGKVLINGGIPVVVSINATAQVLEKAAEIFNKNFMKYILLGESPKDAFNHSLDVLTIEKHTSGICCCFHEHTGDCLWQKYLEESQDEFEAHKLHMPSCKCAAWCSGPIEHRHNCQDYRKFYDTLTKNQSMKLVQLVSDKTDQEGFLRMPSMSGTNTMCCCKSYLPHNESQKFELLWSEKNLEAINEPIFDPKKRAFGKVLEDLPIKFKELPTWLYKDSFWLQDRNLEIHNIVDFLNSKNRMLKIYGQQLSGRTAVVTRAIRIVISRNPSTFRDGVFLVDLENVGITSVITKISQQLQDCQTKPNEESLRRDLYNKKILIVFSDCQMTSAKSTQEPLIKLISRISNWTNTPDGRLKFIVIMQQKFHTEQIDREQSMTIEPMSRYGKIKLFIQFMSIRDKTQKFIESETKIRQHPIFDLVDANYIQTLVNNYQTIESLDHEEIKVRSQLEKQKSSGDTTQDPANTQLKIQDPINALRIRSIVCKDLLKSVPAEYRFEKNLIFFLTLAPAGISETEFVQLTSIYKSWFGTKFQLLENNVTIQVDNEQPQIKNAMRTQTYLDLVESYTDQDLKMSIFKVSKEYISALEFYLDQAELQMANTDSKKSRSHLVSICIEFMGSQARSILRSIRQKERLDYRLVSAHLDCGMWWRYPNEEENFDQVIDQAEQRFASFYLTNFKFLLDEELLTQNFPEIWSGQTSHEAEYITDLCLTVPSILVQLKRFEEAEEIIIQCRQLGGNKELKLHGYLDLMLASIYVYNNVMVISDRDKILQLIQSARAIFTKFNNEIESQVNQIGNAEELAETHFVEATLYMQIFKNQLQQHQLSFRSQQTLQPHSKSNFNDQEYRRSQSQAYPLLQRTQSEVSKQQYAQDIDLVRKIKGALQRALDCFELIDDNWPTETSNKQFGKAKTILAEGDFFINQYCNFTPEEIKQSGFDKIEMLKKLQRAGQLFSERCQSQDNLVIKRSSSYEAGIQLKVQSSRNYEALTICLQAQLKLSYLDNKKPTPDEIAQARIIIDSAQNLIEKVDDNIDKTIREIKNKVLNEMRFLSNNLFTFAKAWPLVQKVDDQIESIGEFPTSRFDLAPKILDAFVKSELDLQVNFDIFNEELLKSILESGSRVLHLSSDIFNSDSLFMEDKIGMCKELKISEMETFFKSLKIGAQFNSKRLPVSCVVLAMPASYQIGKKFFQMGVPHVVCFNLIKDESLSMDVDNQLMPFRFNYIYTFVQKFYISLVQNLSVRQAFEQANEAVNDELIQYDKIWELRDREKQVDLGIKPILIDEDDIRHEKILFNRNCLEREDCYVAPGHLSDCSKQRGLLKGVNKYKDTYIGHKTDLYSAMAALTDQVDVNYLCHIRGRKGTGKTRFLKEVAYYLYQRGYFQFKIHYQDLSDIKTEQAFKDMLQEKTLYEDMRGQSANAVQILMIFDNIDLLPKEIDRNFEGRLIDLIQNNSGIRFLTSSTKKRNFEHFQRTINFSANHKQKVVRMVKINLMQLTPTQAIDLLLSACKREITRKELDLDDANPWTIQKQLMNEEKIALLDNRPENILDFAKRLEKPDVSFKDIKVKLNRDNLKHTNHHHKSRPQTKVKISVEVEQFRNTNKSPAKNEDHSPKTPFHFLSADLENTVFVDQSQSETPDYGRSRAGSYAVHQIGTEVNLNEHMVSLTRAISQIPHNQTAPREILEEADKQEQEQYRERLPSDHIQGELFESKRDRVKVQGARQQKDTKQQNKFDKKETKKQRKVDRYKKHQKKQYWTHQPKDDGEVEPVEADLEETKIDYSSTSPTELTETSQLTQVSTEKKQKKVKKLTKQQREEMEWEDIQQKSAKK